MKHPFRPFAYMRWVLSVPGAARINLTGSGVEDVADDPAFAPMFDGLSPVQLASRATTGAQTQGLRERIAARYGVDTAQVVLTPSASAAITHLAMATLRAGDHVVVERPTYEPLARVPELFGASVTRLERLADRRFELDLEQLKRALTSRTRAVWLSNLHNPSGVAIPRAVLAEVAQLCARVGAWVFVDEVYLDFDFDVAGGRDARLPAPGASVADNVVSWSSLTKGFGVSALRTGWFVSRDAAVIAALEHAADFLHVHMPNPSVALATRALRDAATLNARARAHGERGRAIVQRFLEHEPRIQWVPPHHGLSCVFKLPRGCSESALCEALLQDHGVAVVPGSYFELPGWIRVSYGGPPLALQEGLDAISRVLDAMQVA